MFHPAIRDRRAARWSHPAGGPWQRLETGTGTVTGGWVNVWIEISKRELDSEFDTQKTLLRLFAPTSAESKSTHGLSLSKFQKYALRR